jgi:excisionase family DNA binding protein
MARTHLDPVVPSAQDALLAKEAQLALEKSEAPEGPLHVQISVAGREATTFDLPPVVMELLVDILKETAAGKAVSLVSVEREITTQQAATLLNVSRPYLVGLIEKGELPARMVGSQRRLPLQDVLAYKAENRARRRTALQEMAAADQELGLI